MKRAHKETMFPGLKYLLALVQIILLPIFLQAEYWDSVKLGEIPFSSPSRMVKFQNYIWADAAVHPWRSEPG